MCPRRASNANWFKSELDAAYRTGRELRFVFENCEVNELPRYLEQFHAAARKFLALRTELEFLAKPVRAESRADLARAIAALACFEAEMRLAEAGAASVSGDAAREREALLAAEQALVGAEQQRARARNRWGKLVSSLKRLTVRIRPGGEGR